ARRSSGAARPEAVMKQFGGGGFLGLGLDNTFRAMTAATPIQDAVNLAHRAARQRLEAGGTAAPVRKPVARDAAPADFIVPADVDADEVVRAIERQLADRGFERTADAPPLLKRKVGGGVAVSGYHLLRLGDGRFDRGRRFLHSVIGAIRARQ